MTSSKTVILGYDSVSSLGIDLESNWSRAVEGHSGINKLTRFPLRENFPVQISGQVDEIDMESYHFLNPRNLAHWSSPIFKYGLLVVHRALEKIDLEITQDISPRVATTFSTAIGGLDAVIEADRLMTASGKLPNPFVNPNSCVNMITGKVSILTNATGPILTTITACSTGSTSLIIGDMLLHAGLADVAICGAVDFPIIEPIVAGFATMNGAYKIKEDRFEEPHRASRPFSIDRRGFVISEGAGCIVLSTKDFAKTHGLDFHLEIAGWSLNSDAHHFVAPRQETIVRCISDAINNAGIQPIDISAVNAHAASTKVGDRIEAMALKEVFGMNVPPVSANKSQIGHAMGASSALENIFAMEGMLRNMLLPTINYTPDPEIELDYVIEGSRKTEMEFVLKNAFGFGGCNACIVFRRIF
jgi:3-oxoacyl-[acyl-carrier-protein] synthase II